MGDIGTSTSGLPWEGSSQQQLRPPSSSQQQQQQQLQHMQQQQQRMQQQQHHMQQQHMQSAMIYQPQQQQLRQHLQPPHQLPPQSGAAVTNASSSGGAGEFRSAPAPSATLSPAGIRGAPASNIGQAKSLGGGVGGEASDDSPPLEALQEHYHMSLEQAARALGISLNKLKRACRQYGIPRWPYRQVRSIRSTIQSLKNALEKCDSELERASLKDRLESLIKKESLVCKFASC
ncbi:unnamed protein product, partial [Ectocarpus sp. 12 AP-2014]